MGKSRVAWVPWRMGRGGSFGLRGLFLSCIMFPYVRTNEFRAEQMGRPSKLTKEQWLVLEHRHVVDRVTIEQLVRDLAAEGITISDTAIRRKIKPSMAERAAGVANLRDLAAAKVSADRAVAVVEEQIAELPETRQIIVRDLADRMKSITVHLSCAAEASADTARKLALLAQAQAGRIDISKPMNDKTRDTVSAISAITRTANEAGSIGMGLI